MPLLQLTVYRHDRRKRALITLDGEIDLDSAPRVRAALARCLSDGIRIVDVDLTPVTFCDCSGLNAFLYAAQRTTARRRPGPDSPCPAAAECSAGGCPLGRCAVTAQPEQGQSHKPHADEPFTMDAVRLRRVNRWLALGLVGELADLYADSRETSVPEAYGSRSRQDFLNCLTGDIRQSGFAMVIAETDHLMGCAFGFPVRSDGFWWLGFDGALPQSIEQLTASGGVFAITSILVRPHPQDQDMARRLQERLLSDHQASLGATLVDQDDHPTLTSLRFWGWLDVGEVWRPAGPTMFRALVFPLGERTTARLEGLAHDAWTRWPG